MTIIGREPTELMSAFGGRDVTRKWLESGREADRQLLQPERSAPVTSNALAWLEPTNNGAPTSRRARGFSCNLSMNGHRVIA